MMSERSKNSPMPPWGISISTGGRGGLAGSSATVVVVVVIDVVDVAGCVVGPVGAVDALVCGGVWDVSTGLSNWPLSAVAVTAPHVNRTASIVQAIRIGPPRVYPP